MAKNFKEKDYTIEDIARVRKQMAEGAVKQQEMMNKGNQPAPTFREVPKLETLRRKQIMRGTDPAAKSVRDNMFKDLSSVDRRDLDREEEARLKKQIRTENQTKKANLDRLNNVSLNVGDNDTSRYTNRFSLDKNPNDTVEQKIDKTQRNRAIQANMAKENMAKQADFANRNILTDEQKAQFDVEAKVIQKKMDNGTATYDDEQRLRELYDLNEASNQAEERARRLNGENHVVNNTRYKELMSDERLSNDIDKLVDVLYNNADQDATVSNEWASTIGAKNITGGLTKDQYIDQLSKRYELTKEELLDIALSRKAEQYNSELERDASLLYAYGKKHPYIGGYGIGGLGAIGSGFEGMVNAGIGAITGDDRYASRLFDTYKTAPREGGADYSDSKIWKTLYPMSTGVEDMLLGAMVGDAPLVLAGNTMNRTYLDSLDKGIDPRQAALYSSASGITDYATNKVGLDFAKEKALKSIAAEGFKGALAKNTIAGLGEAGENVLQDAAQAFLDRFINGEDAELMTAYNNLLAQGYSPESAFREVAKEFGKQELMSAAQGYAMGSAMQFGKSALNTAGEATAYAISKFDKGIDEKAEAFQQIKKGMKKLPRVGEEPSIIVDNAKAESAPDGKLSMDDIRAEREANSAPAPTDDTDYQRLLTDEEYMEEQVEKEKHMYDNLGVEIGKDAIRADLENRAKANANKTEVPAQTEPNVQNIDADALDTQETNLEQEQKANSEGISTGEPTGETAPSKSKNGLEMNLQFFAKKKAELQESLKNDKLTIEEKADITKQIKEIDKKISQFATGTALKSGITTEEALDNDPVLRDAKMVTPTTEKATLDEATGRIKEDADGWVDSYNNGSKNIETATDVDTVMTGMRNLDNRIDNATDDASREQLQARKNMLFAKAVQAVHRGGQFLQALKKWNRVSTEGALLNAEKIAQDAVEKVYGDNSGEKTQKNVKTRESAKINDISKKLLDAFNMAKNGEAPSKPKKVLTHDEIRTQVVNTINKVYGETEHKFTDKDIDFLTNLVENGVAKWQIADEIEYFMEHGEFYTIDESLPMKKKMSSQLANVLKNMGNDSLKEKNKPLDNGYPKKSHATIVEEVRNTLETEYAGLGLDKDSDVEFIATMIEEGVPNWQIEDEITHRLNTGEWYTLDESTPVAREKSSKLVRGFKEMGNKTPKKEKQEIGFAKRKERIINTLEDEFGSIDGLFTDEAINQLVDFEEKLPTWQLIDEIEHYLKHGEFYEITEDSAKNAPKMGALSNMLDRISGVETEKAERVPDTYEQIREKVENTFAEDSSSVEANFGSEDYDFIAKMFHDGMPKWLIEDELRYRMENGSWYKIDENVLSRRTVNKKLLNALDKFEGNEKEVTQKPAKTLGQIQEEVKYTLNSKADGLSESAKWTDDDYRYVATLIQNGVSSDDLSNAIKRRIVTGKWGVSDEARAEVAKYMEYAQSLDVDSADRIRAEMRAYKILADEIYGNNGADFKEKFDAWRYLAMLGNPKTHIRNIVGNTLFQGVTGISNTVAAAMEERADKRSIRKGKGGINRTKAVLHLASNANDRALVKGASGDSDKTYGRWSGNKWNENLRNNIESQKRIFKNDAVDAANELNSRLLDAEDNMAMRSKYSTTLAGFLKANGEDASIFDVENRIKTLESRKAGDPLNGSEYDAELENLYKRKEILDKGRDYAIEKAKYSAFHEDNGVAQAISDFSNNLKKKADEGNKGAALFHYMLEGMLPFKKTPANILRSGLEYSPINVIQDAVKFYKYKKGYDNVDLSDVFDSMSKTLTGTAIMALGALMYNKGILLSSNGDEKYQDQLEGKQNYSLRLGDYTATIDFAAPSVMPLLLGAEVMKALEGDGLDFDDFMDAVDSGDINKIIESAWEVGKGSINAASRIASPMVETSMLQGVNNTLEGISDAVSEGNYGDAIGATVGNLLTSYATSAIPTLVGQTARAFDNTRRSTTGGVKSIEKLQNKLPYLSTKNQPYIDAHGRQQTNAPTDNIIGRLAYQMLSPSYIQKVEETEGDKLMREVYNEVKDKDVFSPWVGRKKINGQKVSPEDNTKYMQTRGDADTRIKDALAKDEWFRSLKPADQNDILKKINNLTDKIGEEVINPNFKSDSKALAAYKEDPENFSSLINYYKDSIQSDVVKEAMGSSSDFAKSLYESGNQTDIDMYKDASKLAAEKYHKESITESQFLTYKYDGEKAFEDDLYYSDKANKAGVPDSEAYRKAVDRGQEQYYVDSYNAITSTVTGKDKYNRDMHLSYNDTTKAVYDHGGEASLKQLVKLQNKLDDSLSESSDKEVINVLNDSKMSNKDKAFYFKLHKGKSAIAKKAPQPKGNDYTETYMWYLLKNYYDADNSGQITKAEDAVLHKDMARYLSSLGYTDSQIQTANTWAWR